MPHQRLARRRPDPARVLAFATLRAVTSEGAYANLELARRLAEAGLDARDSAFATELVAGTCRLQGTYDRIVAAAAGRPLAGFKADVLDAVRLGAHQLLSMRVPARAAVAATVELAAAEIGEKVAGLTNAVLRKVAARDLDTWVAELSASEDALGALALRTHHPRWIAEEYVRLLGDGAEEALRANNVAPVPTLVVRPGLAGVGELGGEPTRFSPFGARRAGSPSEVDAVRAGRAGVQDEGSQLVAWALSRVDAPAGPWLDLCAGPGGKAALLAGLALGAGESMLASELQEHRAVLVRQGLRGYPLAERGSPLAEPVEAGVVSTGATSGSRLAEPVEALRQAQGSSGGVLVICADGTRPAWAEGAFARVMADVPCTGLGALRRRPESRWRRDPADVEALVPLQRSLLASALASARPGGVVAYVTCSPHHGETVEVVDAVLAQQAGVTRLRASDFLPGVPGCARGDDVQLWPHLHGTDAMYLALLRVAE